MDWLKRHTPRHLVVGHKAEVIAYHHLVKQGLKLIVKNYSCRYGEIDLIMRQDQIVIFVEVRYRQSVNFGLPQETVNYYKQQKIIKSAQNFLLQKKISNQCPCRFDIVAIHGTIPDHKINWIKDAFYS